MENKDSYTREEVIEMLGAQRDYLKEGYGRTKENILLPPDKEYMGKLKNYKEMIPIEIRSSLSLKNS